MMEDFIAAVGNRLLHHYVHELIWKKQTDESLQVARATTAIIHFDVWDFYDSLENKSSETGN